MNATENRLKFEMEDARRTLDWIKQEQERAEQLAAKCQQQGFSKIQAYFQTQAQKWQQHKQEAHEWYYRAKRELKTLNDKAK